MCEIYEQAYSLYLLNIFNYVNIYLYLFKIHSISIKNSAWIWNVPQKATH